MGGWRNASALSGLNCARTRSHKALHRRRRRLPMRGRERPRGRPPSRAEHPRAHPGASTSHSSWPRFKEAQIHKSLVSAPLPPPAVSAHRASPRASSLRRPAVAHRAASSAPAVGSGPPAVDARTIQLRRLSMHAPERPHERPCRPRPGRAGVPTTRPRSVAGARERASALRRAATLLALRARARVRREREGVCVCVCGERARESGSAWRGGGERLVAAVAGEAPRAPGQ